MNPADVDIRLQKLNEEKKKILQNINVIEHYIKEQKTPMPYFQSVADKFKVYQEKRDDVEKFAFETSRVLTRVHQSQHIFQKPN